MKYTNDKIEQLIAERNATVKRYNREIQNEIDKEKSKYKFSWKKFLLMVSAVIFMQLAFKFNEKIFPKTSIWSWEHYFGEPNQRANSKVDNTLLINKKNNEQKN